MPIHLRKATPVDISVLLAIEESVAGSNLYSPLLQEGEWLTELQQSTVYIIEKDNVVVGNVSYEKKKGSHIYISGLVIHKKFQGHGIARATLLKVLDEIRDVKRVDLVTHPDNKVALRLYQSLGFVVESRRENYFGDGEPRIFLARFK